MPDPERRGWHVLKTIRWIVLASILMVSLNFCVQTFQSYQRRSALFGRELGRDQFLFSDYARRTNEFGTRPHLPGWVYDWVGKERLRPLEPISYAYISPDSDDDLRLLSAELELEQVTIVSENNKCSDKLLWHLAHLPRLWSVGICDVQLTNEGIELLSRMPALKSLYVQCPVEGSPGLKQISQLTQIEKLILLDEVGPDTEDIIRQIAAMPNLKDLRLIHLFPTLKSLKDLAQSTSIEVIYIKSGETLTLDAVRQLAEMKGLKSVEYNHLIEPAALAFLIERGLTSSQVHSSTLSTSDFQNAGGTTERMPQ